MSAGKPPPGVNVYIAQNRGDNGDYCRDMRPVATTDSNGNFQIGPMIEHHLFASLLNPPQFALQETSICFEIAERQYLGMPVVASTLNPKRFVAACDLAAPAHAYLATRQFQAIRWEFARIQRNPFRSSRRTRGKTFWCCKDRFRLASTIVTTSAVPLDETFFTSRSGRPREDARGRVPPTAKRQG